MKESVLDRKTTKEEQDSIKKMDSWLDSSGNVKPLSKKAQEMKIFLERNPIPKEFLKS